MRLRFTKMHGLGNDFVVIDAISQRVKLTPEKVRFIADRRFGIGCDQVLLVEFPDDPDMDFRYRIYNCDGSEVENCGNGARCFAKFVRDRKLTGKDRINVQTAGGDIVLVVEGSGDITVDMGVPELTPKNIPFVPTDTLLPESENNATQQLTLKNETAVTITAVSMGNPHAVTLVNDTATAPVSELGPLIENHSQFPQKVNAGFMQIVSRNEINLRVFERGAGETLACGTGACAAVVAGCLRNLLDSNVKVNLPGGSLQINWNGKGEHLFMTGPAATVCHGQMKI